VISPSRAISDPAVAVQPTLGPATVRSGETSETRADNLRDKTVSMGFVQGWAGNVYDLREQVQVGLAGPGVEI